MVDALVMKLAYAIRLATLRARLAAASLTTLGLEFGGVDLKSVLLIV